MHFRIIRIFFFVAALTVGLFEHASAGEDIPSQHETALLQWINQARQDPLVVAGSLGMDTDRILEDYPDLEDILTEGLPPLRFNDNLYQAASAHTEDMLANNYYSHDSLDGRTCDDRIVESGYDAAATGESLGMLGFTNFIDPDEAVDLIFENMFRDELNPARTEDRNILDPDLGEVGVALGSAAFRVGGSLFNVYVVTCDFGASVPQDISEELMELQLLQLINQARTNPLHVAASLGLDPDQVLADLPELYDVLTQGLPPLGCNEKLAMAARSHIQDMLDNNFYSHDSLDGRTYEDRMREGGYDPVVAGETLGMLAFLTYTDTAEAVEVIFQNMFMAELYPARTEQRNILDPGLKEIGIGFGTGALDLGDAVEYVYLVTCDFGASAEQERSYLTGVVYRDLNQDGLYTPGEGVSARSVIVFGGGLHLRTNGAGGFNTLVDPGGYWVILFNQTEELRIKEVWLEDANKGACFTVNSE